MKFTCEKALLAEALTQTSRAVPSKSPIPVLEGIRIQAGEQVILTGYDMNIGIQSVMEADVREPGALVLNARLFLDIVRRLPDQTLTLESNAEHYATISCGASVFNLIGLSPADYPELPPLQKEQAVSLPSDTLRGLIAGTIFSASENENRPILTGSLFSFSGNILTVVALDMFRMSIRREKVERSGGEEELQFVVPAKALREMERLLKDSDTPVELSMSRKNIVFRTNGVTLSSQLLEGIFVKYDNVIPKTAQTVAEADTSQLIDSLERVSVLISETLRNYVVCDFEQDMLRLTCTTAIGKAYDELPVDTVMGPELRIGFNSRYLLEALRACKTDKVRIELGHNLAACVIKPLEGDDFLYLIVPVRLKDEGMTRP